MRIPHNQSHAGGNVLLDRIAVLASPHTDAMALGKLGSHGSHLSWMRRPASWLHQRESSDACLHIPSMTQRLLSGPGPCSPHPQP